MVTSKLEDVVTGMKTVIEAAITGFEVVKFALEINRPPSANIKRIDEDNEVAVAGSAFSGLLTLEVLVNSNDKSGSWPKLNQFISTGNANSIQDAISADNTLGGKVSFMVLERVVNIGIHEFPSGSPYLGADMIFRFMKQ